jgi:hypothetical protein
MFLSHLFSRRHYTDKTLIFNEFSKRVSTDRSNYMLDIWDCMLFRMKKQKCKFSQNFETSLPISFKYQIKQWRVQSCNKTLAYMVEILYCTAFLKQRSITATLNTQPRKKTPLFRQNIFTI